MLRSAGNVCWDSQEASVWAKEQQLSGFLMVDVLGVPGHLLPRPLDQTRHLALMLVGGNTPGNLGLGGPGNARLRSQGSRMNT